MTPVLISLAVILVVLVGSFITLRIFFAPFRGSLPQPPLAPPEPRPDCSAPGGRATLPGIGPGVTGGVFRAPQITVPAGVILNLTSSLTLVADDLLQVDGDILATDRWVGRQPVNITLVSLGGNVVITGEVGVSRWAAAGQAPDGTSANVAVLNALAAGGAAASAGYVKVVALQGSIDVQGWIKAQGGGGGGSATAVVPPWAIPAGPAFLPRAGGRATAVAAGGGHGGQVRLCAFEAINIASAAGVQGGMGGGGGSANATAMNGKTAIAIGGPSGHGGDVLIDGFDPNCQVFNGGVIGGGAVQFGNLATAVGGGAMSRFDSGGRAIARGGWAGAGGTVKIQGCAFVPPPGSVNAFAGGGGGPATAMGGGGARGLFRGTNGGDADANGGDGGATPAPPVIPLTTGGTANGGVVIPPPPGLMGLAYSKGGDATAKAGSGGTNRLGGGSSGTETAEGGTGASGAAAPVVTAGPVAGGAGGTGGATPLPGGSVSAGTP